MQIYENIVLVSELLCKIAEERDTVGRLDRDIIDGALLDFRDYIDDLLVGEDRDNTNNGNRQEREIQYLVIPNDLDYMSTLEKLELVYNLLHEIAEERDKVDSVDRDIIDGALLDIRDYIDDLLVGEDKDNTNNGNRQEREIRYLIILAEQLKEIDEPVEKGANRNDANRLMKMKEAIVKTQ